MSLSVIGDDAATAFFEINEDGEISVKDDVDLTTDTETEYRVRK